MSSDDLSAEAKAFDDRIAERVRNGHIPDLRRVEPCDWFYNNPWRRPYFVAMDHGRAFQFALEHARRGSLLELGSGVGHMSLEFARNGFDVTGLELAPGCLAVARRLADENPYREGFGRLRYLQSDFFEWKADRTFDTICMFGVLHHFSRVDEAVNRAFDLLSPGGRIIVCEPARDWPTAANGVMMALLRVLLSQRGLWFEKLPLPASEEDFRQYAKVCLKELCEGHDPDEAEQSPNDNSSAAETMLAGLRRKFSEVECRRINGFLQRVIGGLRGRDEDETRRLAEFLDIVDKSALATGMIQPAEMYWVGQKN
ncbi:MAG: class I SAM-dependent methyltransferase [Acidobacteria bacterium]|nr:MAG: class I SAM-dependent methyltransferase [Acidobacteriota bacterium]